MLSFYRAVKKIIPVGKLSSVPARKIDDIYIESKPSVLSTISQFFKTRTIYALTFPFTTVLDTMGSVSAASLFKIGALFSGNDNKKSYQKLASKYYDLTKKNLMAVFAYPIGLVSPKLVAFYFIPKRQKQALLQSGGHLYAANTDILYPKTVAQLQAIILQADIENKKITVMGAGRSQGKQFFPGDNNTIVINMKYFNNVNVDQNSKIVTAGAGATWGDIQLEANKSALAVKVMQASNVFSVGGSISTNIHGWNKTGTVAKTLKAITIVNAAGNIERLTPQDELFNYVVGGLNQFGVIIEAELELTDNEVLLEKSVDISPSQYIEYFKNNVKDNPDIRMHLYRLSLDPNNLLSTGVAVNYSHKEGTAPLKTPDLNLEPKNGTRFERIFINLARRFGFLRKFLWWYTKRGLLNNVAEQTTNEIMQPSINAMFNNSLSESEWLQEYFIPAENLDKFLKELGSLLGENQVALLNATVRYVKQDDIAKMGYANNGDRYAVVLCWNQLLNETDIIKAKKWIRKATDLSVDNGGTYYLPYQDFASKAQFERGYPTHRAVYQKKLEVDPKAIFTSGFSKKYLQPAVIENNPYKNILATHEDRALFGQFLDNILERVDKEKLYPLLDNILSYADTPREIYSELSKRIHEVMPSAFSSAKRIYTSLEHIKTDLSDQAAALMSQKWNLKYVDGLIEIGYPGRFVNSFKQKFNITGQVTVINDAQSWTDVIQSGFPKPYDRFVPLNDYAPLNALQFKDNSVDMITCFIGLHHIPNNKINDFVDSLNRVLRPGGSFLLVDHDAKDAKTRDLASLAHSVYNAVMGAPIEEEMNEIRNFKPLDEWIALLNDRGFEVEAPQKLVRNGDPTVNTMMRFVKKMPEVKAKPAANVEDNVDPLLFSTGLRNRSAVQQHAIPDVRVNATRKFGLN